MRAPNEGGPGWADRSDAAFVRRVLIVVAVVTLALLLWALQAALLLVFAGIVVAVLLRALAQPLERRLGLAGGWSLLVVALALGTVLVGAAFAVGSDVQAQLSDLAARMPVAAEHVAARFGLQLPWMERSGGQPAPGVGLSTVGTLAQQALGLGAGVLSAVSGLVVALVGGVFLAADPRMYRRGVALLLPRRMRGEAVRAMVACGRALRLWMGAQLVAMVFVGVLSGLGAWALGLPAPLALGLFAGLANMVPFLGAFVGAVPAVMLALSDSMATTLWTSALFLVIQQLEGNLVTPMVQRHMVSLPPALLVFAVVAVGILFGLAGVVLAAPITVCVYVLVKQLYVRQTLGTPTEVPGEPE
jgi:predicted PurR-regulated permease PerM